MIDLLSVVLTLQAQQSALLPANLGWASPALFLRLLNDATPELAARLHDIQGPRPFTCSTLWGARASGKQMPVSPQDTLFLRYTVLTEELAQL